MTTKEDNRETGEQAVIWAWKTTQGVQACRGQAALSRMLSIAPRVGIVGAAKDRVDQGAPLLRDIIAAGRGPVDESERVHRSCEGLSRAMGHRKWHTRGEAQVSSSGAQHEANTASIFHDARDDHVQSLAGRAKEGNRGLVTSKRNARGIVGFHAPVDPDSVGAEDPWTHDCRGISCIDLVSCFHGDDKTKD